MINSRDSVPGRLNQNYKERLCYILSRLPSRVSGPLLPLVELLIGRKEPYFFETTILDRRLIMGGWVGASPHMIQARLDCSDPETYRTYARILSPDEKGVILDIGANFGQSLLLFKTLAPDAPVYCFEPIRQAADFLERLMARNSFSDCRLCRAALGDGSTDKVLLSYGVSSSDTASYAIDQPHHTLTQEAPAMTLDAYLSDRPSDPIALIKIDVEGAEPDVIAGAMGTLRRHRPPIVMEVLAVPDLPGGVAERTRGMEERLRRLGYRWYWITASGKLVEQDPIAPDPAWRYKNYLLLPEAPPAA